MEHSITTKIEYYLDLALKRRWLLIIPFCIAMMVGMLFAVTLPKIYEAKTLILVTAQRVPSNYVKSVVSSDIESRISTISQQILSRTNLEKVISEFGLFSDPKYSKLFLDDMVGILRKRIKVAVNKLRRADSFSISVKGPDPERVMKVTNGLAGSFIEGNLKVREAQAVGTSDFLRDELEMMRKRLEEVESNLREYRRKYMGELPEQLDANLRILGRYQDQLNAREGSLRDEKTRLVAVEHQIEAARKTLIESRRPLAGSEDDRPLSLEQLKSQLATLRSNYTDRHPDVIKLQIQIAALGNQRKNGGVNSPAESQSDNIVDPALLMVSNELKDLMRQRLEIRAEINKITFDAAKINGYIKEYQERVERTPSHEQELLTLNRDYNNMQDSYNSLLNRKLEAEISVNMEKKQKGEQFRIIDHAVLPHKPVSPNIEKLFMLSAAAGLGLGAGLIYLLDLLNTSLRHPKDYESELGLVVLATIPKLISPREKLLRRINWALTFCSLAVAVGLTGVFGLLIIKGVDPVLNLVSRYVKI